MLKWCYPLYVVMGLVFAIIAVVLAPVLPALASSQFGPVDNNSGFGTEPRLPEWLDWFMTPDNSLLGDGTFKAQHDGGYWSQVQWLWRNPAYGFDHAAGVLPFLRVAVHGDNLTADNPGYEGWRCYTDSMQSAFHFLWVKKVGFGMCTHFEFGWKFDTGALVFSPRFSKFVALA